MSHSYQRIILTVFLTTMLTSCGGGGGSSQDGLFTSSLDDTRQIKTLTESEYQHMCIRFRHKSTEQLKRNKVGFCTLVGLFSASVETFGDELNETLPDTCEESLVSCLNSPIEQSEDRTAIEECLVRPDGIPGCDATIAQLNVCLNETLANGEQALTTLSCDSATSSHALEQALVPALQALSEVAPSTACNSLKNQCSQLFIDSSTSVE